MSFNLLIIAIIVILIQIPVFPEGNVPLPILTFNGTLLLVLRLSLNPLQPGPNMGIAARYITRPKRASALRHAVEETLTGTLGVKSKLFGVRRRLIRLERNVLYIHANGDDCGEPLASTRVCEALGIVVNRAKACIQVKISSKTGITLVFKHDVSLMQLWANALRRAHTMTLENYYKVCGRVAKGHYATVFKAVDRVTGERVAVKEVPKMQEYNRMGQYVRREGEIVRIVEHDHVVRTIDVFETSKMLYIVMEFVEGGTMLDFLAGGKNRINEKNALRFVNQLLRAIAYIHSQNIIHRDVKPENVLVTEEGTIKLADFGLARVMDGVCSDEYCLSSILGTPAYCSPEVVTKSQYGKPVDIFGCGVLLYIALSGALPFRGSTPEQVFHNIATNRAEFPKSRWALISPDARDLVEKLISFRAADRPTALEALAHPWLNQGDSHSTGERPISPRPFLRNASARVPQAACKPPAAKEERVTSTPSFPRAHSGRLPQASPGRRRGAFPFLSDC